MENSKKPRLNKKTNSRDVTLLQQLNTFFSGIFSQQNRSADDHSPVPSPPPIIVALSGGFDSCVLLHLLHELKKSNDFELSAHHVHHGLNKHADYWADFCQTTCDRLHIPLVISKVQIDLESHLGIESAARQTRYRALFNTNTGFICTAHHQDDQAETLLLQLARGAGVKGLSAMAQADFNKQLLRPLLDISRTKLEEYATQHQLKWIEDDSNHNQRFDRNFMRHSVLPILQQQYPAIKQNLARAASHLAEANDLLDVLAAQDAAACTTEHPEQLFLTPLLALSQNRTKNVLRWWLAKNDVRMPSVSQLQQIMQQLLHAKSDAAISIKLSAADDDATRSLSLKRYQQRAYLVTETTSDFSIDFVWNNASVMDFPDHTSLHFTQQSGDGLALKCIGQQSLTIKTRSGGEHIKLHENRPRQNLKAVMQALHIPPWQRENWPLIYLGDTFVAIPNIGVDVSFKAHSGEQGLVITWTTHND